MNLQENVTKLLMLSKAEQDFRSWSHKLPAFHFDKE